MKRLKLDQLTVTSFITGDNQQVHIVKGGQAATGAAQEAGTGRAGSIDIPTFDFPTINDSCFSWCAKICNDYPTGNTCASDCAECTYFTCPKF